MKKKNNKNRNNNIEEGKCPNYNCNDCPTKKSFENSGGIITDNEYEISSEIEDKERYIEKETTD